VDEFGHAPSIAGQAKDLLQGFPPSDPEAADLEAHSREREEPVPSRTVANGMLESSLMKLRRLDMIYPFRESV
jgi:hypothetical protein